MTTLPPVSGEPRGDDAASSTVRTIAIMGILFGLLGLICLPLNFGMWAAFGWPIRATHVGALGVWVWASTFAGLALSALLTFSSFGCFRFQRWGCGGLLLWSVLSLVYGAAGIYFWGRFLVPSIRHQYSTFRGPDMVSGLIAWGVGTIYAAFVLYYLTRPRIRAVFGPTR